MNNKEYYSCERNHYFFGKLMTVRDFENEQVYLNSKRRLGNRMLNGAGIVCGLDIIMVDSRTISLESGMAIDYEGREIVVAEPNVKRLNVIKGFEENREKGYMYLCLKYKEELKESTFSVAGSGKDSGLSQEYNRVSESYDLFLTSKEPSPYLLNLNNLMFSDIVVYDENGIRLTIQIPKYTNPNSIMKFFVLLEKNNVSLPVSFEFDIQGDLFKSVNGQTQSNISYQETEVSTYKRIKKEYYMECDAISEAVTDIVINKDSFSINIGNNKNSLDNDIKHSITVTERRIYDVIIDNYYSMHFDEITEVKEDQNIYLAKFYIISNQSTYVIENIEKNPFNQYLLNNDLLNVLQLATDSIYIKHENNTLNDKIEESSNSILPAEISNIDSENIVTGVERINMGFYPKVGKPYYSYEFIHGLGYGRIGVITAIENKANYLKNDENILIFGDAEIFNSEDVQMSTPLAKVGAIVNPDKGTMKLGVKLLEKTTEQTIDVRWWAFKPKEKDLFDEDIIVDDKVNVVITPNTVRTRPLEQVRFSAKVEGSSNQGVIWEVTEDGGGKIDKNGLYTAPPKEGVYEIRAKSVKFDNKVDSAYVVVTAE